MRLRLTLLVCCSFLLSTAVRADTREALGESLFLEGKRLFEAKRYDEACPKLAESQRVDPRTGTLLANAICHEKQGKLATARSEYSSVATRAHHEGNEARERHAREKATALGAMLSTLTLTPASELTHEADFVVELDGTELGAASLGTPLPLDGGPHVVRVRIPGSAPHEMRFELATSNDRRDVTLHLPTRPAADPTRVSGAPGADADDAPVAPTKRPSPALRRAGIALTAVGGAALIASAGWGVRARRRYADSRPGCQKDGPVCTDESSDIARDDAYVASRITNYTALAGGVTLVGGVVTWLLAARRTRSDRSATVWLAPSVDRRTAAIALGSAF